MKVGMEMGGYWPSHDRHIDNLVPEMIEMAKLAEATDVNTSNGAHMREPPTPCVLQDPLPRARAVRHGDAWSLAMRSCRGSLPH